MGLLFFFKNNGLVMVLKLAIISATSEKLAINYKIQILKTVEPEVFLASKSI